MTTPHAKPRTEPTSSDVAAAEIARLRRAAGLTRVALAELCARAGLPLSSSALANIETGRRDKDGRRRRDVSVDEIVVFAEVFDVTPMSLISDEPCCRSNEVVRVVREAVSR